MKCIFEVSSRTTLAESAEVKHEKLIRFLKTIESPWGIPKDIDIPFPGFGKEATAILTLNKYLASGVKMTLFYSYRNRLEDDSFYDDRIYVEFNSKKIDYTELISVVFPQFIKGFCAYTAVIFDQLLIYKDFEDKRFGNNRKIISRVYPVSFYDETLCKLFFKRSPKKIADLLQGHVYKSEVFNDGILIIADTKPFSIVEAIDFEKKMKVLLGY
jgi:hypothetical protein